MTEKAPAEGVSREIRKGLQDRRRHEDARVAQRLADIASAVKTAEALDLRSAAIDVTAHDRIMAIIGSVGEDTEPRKRLGFIPRRRRPARAQLPTADESGQLTLPFSEE